MDYRSIFFHLRPNIIQKDGEKMANKNDAKTVRRNSPEDHVGGQPEPLKGSHKVKNRNHTRQKKNSSHDM